MVLFDVYLKLGHRDIHSTIHRSVTFDKWINHFFKPGSKDCTKGFLNVENPFGDAENPLVELRGQPWYAA